MIRRLKWKFVVAIMALVTIMMTLLFGMLYHFTRVQLEQESVAMMRSVVAEQRPLGMPGQPPHKVQLPYFALQIGMNREVVDTLGGFYDLSDREFLQSLVTRTLQKREPVGTLEELNLRYCWADQLGKKWIVFADMSSEQATLRNLMQTCVVVELLSLGGFFVLSLILARWAVRPVEQAWDRQRQFVADASHELKTPLTILITNAQLLQEEGWDGKQRRQFAQHIQAMARHMNRLVEQMLELSRGDLAPQNLPQEEVDLSRLVSDGVLPHEGVLFERGLTLQCCIQEGIVVRGNALALKQVLDGLLDNAGKYAQGPGEVTVSLTRMSRRLCLLSVSNPGEPIPPQQRQLIFQRFYRADPAHSRTGSFGLGLAIAQNLVAQHRGRIWAESKEGFNTFLVQLPCIGSHGKRGVGE